jgi:hypothetical protein
MMGKLSIVVNCGEYVFLEKSPCIAEERKEQL